VPGKIQPSDSDLVNLARHGDLEAFGELVRRYQAAVFSVCYRLLGERRSAEDLAQETFLRAFLRLETYQAERPFGPWIRRVAANLSINEMKASRLMLLPLEDEDAAPTAGEGDGPEETLLRQDASQTLARGIRSLRPHQRAVIELSHFQELSYAEIAAELEIPLSDVKSHLFRARKRLAEILRHD
jgi:RNA polymerase sigma-70 factor (ECF subfamily)